MNENAQPDDAIRAIIIAWLGGKYDPERRYPGNPDYVQPEDVDELVAQLRAASRPTPTEPDASRS